MHKFHVTVIALLLAGAAVVGAVAVARTTGLGSAARHTNDATFAARARQLTSYAAKLRKELKARPPALPQVPKQPPAAAPASATPRVVYHQPPPVIVTVHHRQGDDGAGEGGGGGRND
jgi:hypothetical protein